MNILFVLGSLLAVTNAASLLQEEWSNFKLQHDKKYSSFSEEQLRFENFFNNKQRIEEHNKKFERGEVSFRMGINKFAELSHEEFQSFQNGFNSSLLPRQYRSIQRKKVTADLPSFVDWRQKGAVTPVKDQTLLCLSCWAFSTTGSIEGQHFLKTGELVSLSEQNLVDCSHNEGTLGCDGGLVAYAMQFVIDNGGLDTEESYPYEAKEGTCRYNTQSIGATISSYVDLPRGDEEALKEAVANIGPISAGIYYSFSSLHLYESGIFYDEKCMSNYVNHGVLVVGYGTENGTDYWIVKNSFGESWGENGYFRLARNRNNHCGIAFWPTYPII